MTDDNLLQDHCPECGEWESECRCDDPELCAMCGKPATGFATVNDDRLCHGDDDPTPTCYEKAQSTLTGVARASAPTTPDPETDWELYFARKAQFLKEQRNEARAERDAYKAAWAELEASIKNDDEQVSPLLRLHFFAAKYGLDETKP